MTHCEKCKTELTATDKFCPKCGHVNDAKMKQVPTPAAPSTTSRKKLSGCAIAAIVVGSLFAIVGIIIVVAIVLAFSLTAPAVDAIDNHLAALKSDQIERAYEGTSAGFKGVTSLDDYRHFVESYPVLKDVSETSFDAREIENGIATLKGHITNSNGGVVDLHAKLKKEGDTWKVQAIDLPGVQAVKTPPVAQSQAPPSVKPATPASTPQVAPPSTSPVAPQAPPVASGESAVGSIVIGSGRNADGSLVNPGQPVPLGTPTISADIALIDHPLGERVQVWVEQGQNRTKPIDGVVKGQGSGMMPFELHVGDSAFPAGNYTLVVGLGESKRFTQAFTIK